MCAIERGSAVPVQSTDGPAVNAWVGARGARSHGEANWLE